MPTPAEAAAILRNHFGFAAEPTDDASTYYGDPSGALTLAKGRDAQVADLGAEVDREAPGAFMPVESFVPGDPGRRQITQPFAADALGDAARLRRLQGT